LSDEPPADGVFLESLTDSSLYSIGAYFTDRHPDLVDDVLEQSDGIQRLGLARWAGEERVSVESAFQTLVTGLAIRYFRAVAGGGSGPTR
jgi:hypothetical protein